ncbi:endonuclease/exonuclease/phosphatase family protein [Ligilactobacillus saerimneri]|uniref:endonuclease/exonuclease/phosphatase family protein n=1 Tax=Ligilactobacillus saerimneri TaxID=228229 RepID=UPI0029425D01|nr:endonuclease/exonuclease/phosphatase family protein [Ligilactobacillus saerimneri]
MNSHTKITRRLGQGIVILLGLLVLVIASYVIYMQSHYYRIKDHQKLTIKDPQQAELVPGQKYTALTYNIGFGAYNQKYSFFMDTGRMANGQKTQGKYGTAVNKQTVLADTNGAITTLKQQQPDFALMQEVDTNSTRSFHVNQVQKVQQSFPHYASVFASNFHSGYIFLPLNNPHGAVRSGLLSLSKYRISQAERRKYPVTSSFISKFTDLDRCFEVLTIPVKNHKQLLLINSHMSAYDKGGEMRKKQLKLLNHVMEAAVAQGNYVIVGGDFNHAFGAKMLTHFKNKQQVPDWVSVLSSKNITSKMRMVHATNEEQVPTCRATDIPYQKGVNYETVIDGFLVSPNVTAHATNIDTQFQYADHNPVKLSFTLQ